MSKPRPAPDASPPTAAQPGPSVQLPTAGDAKPSASAGQTTAATAESASSTALISQSSPAPNEQVPCIKASSWELANDEFRTNLKRDTPRGKAMLLNAMSPADIDLGPEGTVVFIAVAYVCYNDEVESQETGEVVRCVRTVFIDREGRTFRTTSESGLRKVAAMMAVYTPQEWAVGIAMRVTLRKSRLPGRHYHDIRVVVPEA
jgi:hypothetical protein